MRHAPSTLHFSHAYPTLAKRPGAPAGAIEWEELPSLVGSLGKRLAAATQSPWDATQPAGLDLAPPPSPFREPVHGLTLREVHEPDVFRHFFGR